MSIVERSLQKLKSGFRADRLPAAASGDPERGAVKPVEAGAPAVVVQQLLAARPVVSVSMRQAVGQGLAWPPAQAPKLAAHMRLLKRQVLDRVQARPDPARGFVLVVSSASSGDGKSFTAFNLALALATERDLAVTLVDGDLIRQKVSGVMRGETTTGLVQCIGEGTPLSSVVLRTDIERLSVVPAGSRAGGPVADPSEETLDRVVADMRSMGGDRVFVVDAAPLLATGDAQGFAQRADLLLFVVRVGVTPVGAVGAALEQLGDHGRVAVVLNGGVSADTSAYYDYDYYRMPAGEASHRDGSN